MFYVHKYDIGQVYGGPEEGGWWYKAGEPVEDWTPLEFQTEQMALVACRGLNIEERARAEREEDYGYTSVLSYRSDHYEYDISESPVPVAFPENRPYYE